MKDKKNLMNKLESTFVKKECDLTKEVNLASLIKAASQMALPSDIISRENALDELTKLYEVDNNEYIMNLIEVLAPGYVKSNIGYSVDFTDASRAIVNYQAQKDIYDGIYSKLDEMHKSKEVETKQL